MNNSYKIISVDKDNLNEHPGLVCFINPKNEIHKIKIEWVKKRLKEGLRIKLLYIKEEKKPAGFIEYIPGEYAWRGVDARGYLFIHCLWIYANKNKSRGYGTLLINECLKDAIDNGMSGAAVVVSESSFMAEKKIFIKNGFKVIDTYKPYDLMIKSIKESPMPKIYDAGNEIKKYKGLNIIYSNQCPWVTKSIKDLCITAEKNGLKVNVTEIKTAKQAQKAPSVYSVFNLIYNGKLLADHYISTTRFQNIIKKEILI